MLKNNYFKIRLGKILTCTLYTNEFESRHNVAEFVASPLSYHAQVRTRCSHQLYECLKIIIFQFCFKVRLSKILTCTLYHRVFESRHTVAGFVFRIPPRRRCLSRVLIPYGVQQPHQLYVDTTWNIYMIS